MERILQKPVKQQQKCVNIPIVEDFRSLMMSTRNEELAELRDKKERSCNIIIHGKEESTGQQSDVLFVNKMMEQISTDITPKSVTRIERSELNKKKPIKVVFQNERDKEKVMNNLCNLKGNTEYIGISIRDDYTVSERKIIKEFVSKARDKNSLEPENSNFIWKIRGTPKNGLLLKRFMKVKPQHVVQN